MKKLLLVLFFSNLIYSVNGQLALNEIYTRPGNGNSEYLEIYNNAKTAVNIDLDCFSVLTYWQQGSSSGWYVLDLPQAEIQPGGYYTAASADPFNIQGHTGLTAGVNWNNLPATASLRSYQLNSAGTGYDAPIDISGNMNDFFQDLSGIGTKYVVLLYKQGIFVQGFLGGASSNVLPAAISSMPDLVASTNGACTSETFSFSGISGSRFLYSSNESLGNDNGFIRLYDGNCAAWDKASTGTALTPNATNNPGALSPYDGSFGSAQFIQCITNTQGRVIYSGTGVVSGAATEATIFPLNIKIFTDASPTSSAPNHVYDPGVDVLLKDTTITSLADFTNGAFHYDVNDASQNINVVILYSTYSGCYEKVYALTAGCGTLPVIMTYFTATRDHSNVLLKWQTATERNNTGFSVERNVNGIWETVGFVTSQSLNGNSDMLLSYQYNDFNTVKGITQYRIRQSDIDGKSKYSDIRAIRGDGQTGKTVVYPNPTIDGKVNVVFEETNLARDISVTDISGRVIRQIKAVTANTITISNLIPGMYTLRIVIETTGEQIIEKLVVGK